MTTITDVDAWQILDSRGNPTVRVRVEAGAHAGTFSVPAGASTGTHEATERRDGGERYGGRGVTEAVEAVRNDLGPAVIGRDVTAQRSLDRTLVEVDGTPALSRTGANAVLGVSGAIARAASDAVGVPLYEYLAPERPGRLPLPMVNVLSGGEHAAGGMAFQDVLVVPVGAASYPEALEGAWAVRRGVRDRLFERGERPLVADEGGFSPGVESIDEAIELLLEGVDAAHGVTRADVGIALDVAATHFYDGGAYHLERPDRPLDRGAMVDLVVDLVERYPIVSVEDPLAEDDWDGWAALVERIGSDVQVIGDDLVVTNRTRVERAREADAATAVLVKPNQAGTLTRAIDVIDAAADAGWGRIVSARSGETCDTTIADLAVARDVGQIKIGSLARSERLAKYNRLLEIDLEHDGGLADPDTVFGRYR